MLPPLLVALLCAASDSASLLTPEAQRAADSAALERISPLPAPAEPIPAMTRRENPQRAITWLPDSASPLAQGSVGLGFRVLGPSPRLHLQLAITPSNFLRLRGSMSTKSESEDRELREIPFSDNGFVGATRSKSIEVEQNLTAWEIQLAIGGLGLCQGSLCGTWSVGPFLGREISTTQNAEILSTLDYEFRERIVLDRQGVAASTGLQWQFRPGLALSADVGASWARLSGDHTQTTISDFADETTSADGERSGSEFVIQFLGVGLDAWF